MNMQTLRESAMGLLITASAAVIVAARTGIFGTNNIILKDSDKDLGIKYHNIKHTKHMLYEELTYESSDEYIWNPPPIFAVDPWLPEIPVGSKVTSNKEHWFRSFQPIKWVHNP